MDRRKFLTLGSAALATSLSTALARAASATQRSLVFDAMGEIRTVYSAELLREILDSGLNAVTVTLSDPKAQEEAAFQSVIAGILEYDRYIRQNSQVLLKASRSSDIDEARRTGRLAIFYLTQNSTHIGRDLDRVDLFYSLGQRSLQLTYNHQNWVGAGCKERTGAGLTIFGLELVAKLNDARVLIDLSHASEATMADAIAASRSPVVVSHTACLSVHPNVRNTSDANMRALAKKGGVIGICQIRPFLTDQQKPGLEVYLRHLRHAINVAGVDHVAIGSDRDHRTIVMTPEYLDELKREEGPNFNPSDWPLFIDSLNGPRRMEVIWDGLLDIGLSEDEVEKVMGKNLYRIYREVIG